MSADPVESDPPAGIGRPAHRALAAAAARGWTSSPDGARENC
jgi:hypothetical protein